MPAHDPRLRRDIARKASLTAAGKADPALDAAINHARILAYAQKVQTGAPPLTPAQIDDIVAVLVGPACGSDGGGLVAP